MIIELSNGTIWTIHGRDFVPELKTDLFEEGAYTVETIEKPNGEVMVNQGLRWSLYDKNGKYIFTIGEGSATLIRPDGTKTMLPKDTVIDVDGRIIN